MSRDVEGCRGRVRSRAGGFGEEVREREREEGRQVVPHGVPRHPTMRGCGPPRVEREGKRGTKRADGTRRKGVTEAVVEGEGICDENKSELERKRQRRRGTERRSGKVKRGQGKRRTASVIEVERYRGCRMMERGGI